MTATDALCYAIATVLRPTPAQEWLASLTIPVVTPDSQHDLSLTKEPSREYD